MKQGKNAFIFSFLIGPVLLYLVFVIGPYLSSMVFSFTRWKGLSANIRFNGVNNFIKLWDDENFWNALSHNAIAVVLLPLVTISIALVFAFWFTQGVRGSRFFRVAFFFPQVMSVVIIAVLWSFIYNPQFGVLNGIIKFLGIKSLESFPWLGDSSTIYWCILVVVVWQSIGFYMVLFIAGMMGIPNEYYEAAKLDGASLPVIFFQVTIPLLWETVRTGLVFIAIAAMDLYAMVMVITSGRIAATSRAADVLSTYIYETAFENGDFSYGIAMAVVMMFIILGLSYFTLTSTRKEVLEY
ncbi:MAG: sugar ABC transporter permease [Anaerolineae bacterium]|nr:sugar ABC transporter permease [Anaerolineae bacterium]